MLKNYFKIAWRNLLKDKTFTSINIVGLSVAFAVVILLSMAAFFDLSYDGYHENKDNIYKVYTEHQTASGQEAGTSKPTPFANALKREVPGIVKITRFLENGALALYEDKQLNMDAIWVDSDFFSMFTFPVLKGDNNEPLQELTSAVITQKAAIKIFGKTDVVGKVFNILIKGKEQPFTISAVVENYLPQSTLGFEIALRFENNAEYADTKEVWDSQYHEVYVELENRVLPSQFEQNTHPFIDLHYSGNIENAKRDGAVPNANGQYINIKLLPLKDVHFTSFRKGYAVVSRSSSYLILGVAFLILFIACVNFINMSIAKASQRLKEIGMRKALGAQKKQLFFQFWCESLFVFLTSMGIGSVLSFLLLDVFKTNFRTAVSLDIMSSPYAIIGILCVVLVITLFVGGYPAILLSRLGTIQCLKGKLESSGKNRIRDGLMVIQFSIAIVLIIGTLVFWKQVDYMRSKDLGYDKEQIISFPLNGKKNSYEVVQLLREELASNPNVLSVAGADNNLGLGKDGSRSTGVVGFDYKGRVVRTNFLVTDYAYQKTLGLDIVTGRSFESASDSLGVVINESMARELGEKDPLSSSININGNISYPILGVVKDYNFQDLNRAIEPITFFMNNDLDLSYVFVKVVPSNMANSFEIVESAWKKIEPNADFLGSFLDENIERTFRREKTTMNMITSGSIIAIALNCMGLFAMSLLIVAQRTKEIGIRKVVGASTISITYILTRDFLKLVFIAFLIASPIAWWLTQQWLQNYNYRINLNIWYFITAGLLAVVIALLTIGTRTIKAAVANPVKSLRDE